MKLDKKTLSAAAVAGVIGVGSISAAAAAHEGTTENSHPPIVKKLSEKFNLDEDKVHQVFLDERQEHAEKRQQKIEERLDQAVKDGELTEQQKSALLAKLDELKPVFNDTKEDRRQNMQDRHEQLKTWAEENGINLDELGLKNARGFGPRHSR